MPGLAASRERLGLVEFASELDLDDFVEPLDAERQGEREDDAGAGVEPGGGLEREVGAAEHALGAAHEVVVGEQPERAGLGEAEAEFVTGHRSEAGIADCGFAIDDWKTDEQSVAVFQSSIINQQSAIRQPLQALPVREGSDGGRRSGARMSGTWA